MKLAEALLLRADLQKKIEHLQHRIRPVLIVAAGKQPQEDPVKLIAQLRDAIEELHQLVVKINKTNNTVTISGDVSLMEALAKRDALKMLSERLRNIRQSAQVNNFTDKDQVATIDIKKIQIEIDQTGRSFREVDSKIQEANWLNDLIE
ncbi:DIP1984 family protein [Neolewinella antarctica]|uniref:Formiminotetrahydrofolate cyclodeaminase n=1 Tax=Neolewinella antarctica TaxID=442734 RepID=A0ABX0XD11_9BACT|nr:DIP1984 family protein [Neolewinella antarctica]NJC27175.1 formiminotetrahydrofolate cyclodeaminase [Neolewinella antarctica]